VDIIKWDRDVKVYVANALAPAKLRQFEVDEASHRIKVLVAPDQLSLAIGKRGQNARLTSKLTGWHVDIEPEEVAQMGFEQKVAQAVAAIAAIPGVTREQADILVHRGFLSLEDLLQAEYNDLADIPEIAGQAGALIEAVRTEAAKRNPGK
ncbi:MAG TPA: transcription termination/antitermination protein NusA, partial [Verrucomicrobiae bacterium]|nr:transcription termination/antitermination protein NusA [Verrucomicrobiae bacterium]